MLLHCPDIPFLHLSYSMSLNTYLPPLPSVRMLIILCLPSFVLVLPAFLFVHSSAQLVGYSIRTCLCIALNSVSFPSGVRSCSATAGAHSTRDITRSFVRRPLERVHCDVMPLSVYLQIVSTCAYTCVLCTQYSYS